MMLILDPESIKKSKRLEEYIVSDVSKMGLFYGECL